MYNWYIIAHEGWKWKTLYILVCIIIKQVFFWEGKTKEKVCTHPKTYSKCKIDFRALRELSSLREKHFLHKTLFAYV